MRFKHFIYLLPISLTLSSCRNGGTFKFTQDFIDFTFYKQGSYWVYRDSANPSITDSVIIVSEKSGVYSPVESGQWFQYDDYTEISSFYDSILPRASTKQVNSKVSAYTEQLWGNYIFFDPSRPGDSLLNGGRNISPPFADSVQVAGKWYSNIRIFTIKDNGFMPRFTRLAVWSKNIGMIKKVNTDGHVWELVRWHVVR